MHMPSVSPSPKPRHGDRNMLCCGVSWPSHERRVDLLMVTIARAPVRLSATASPAATIANRDDHQAGAMRGKHRQHDSTVFGEFDAITELAQSRIAEMRRQREMARSASAKFRRLGGGPVMRCLVWVRATPSAPAAVQDPSKQSVERRRLRCSGYGIIRIEVPAFATSSPGDIPLKASVPVRSIRFQRAIHGSPALNNGIA